MKVIIAGSRDLPKDHWPIYYAADAYIKSGFAATEIVSGTARGIDLAGEQLATERGIPIKRFPADWNTHGKAAGYIRNKQMAEYADALIAVWAGGSAGTRNMIQEMKILNKPVYILELK